jgi:beta-lactamase class A
MKKIKIKVTMTMILAGALHLYSAGVGEAQIPKTIDALEARISAVMGESGARFGIAYRDLRSDELLLINPDEEFHAASTMKTPIMMRLYRMADAGGLQLDARVVVRNQFTSIYDGSIYELTTDDDSELSLYDRIGDRVPVLELIELMIAYSSNLATNILVETADPDSIAAMLEAYGAGGMKVLRGVEDIPAYSHGLNNTTTARGMLEMFTALGRWRMASKRSTREMLQILLMQEFNGMIPEGLPPDTPVAHKTGWITAVDHDGGIVDPFGAAPYVLVVLTSGVEDPEVTRAAGAEVSRLVREWRASRRR